jgi:DNA invertase Pin-like site-specific DNA recombinase
MGGVGMKVYGYVRVSTKDQNTDRQHEALKEYAKKNNIKYAVTFEDKASGKNFERVQYQQ